MSMDLAKQEFSTIPEYLIASDAEVVTAVKTAASALKKGAPVIIDSNGKVDVVPVESGSAVTTGLYGIASEDTKADEEVVVYLSGEFFADALVLPDDVTIADLEIPFRNIGIYLK